MHHTDDGGDRVALLAGTVAFLAGSITWTHLFDAQTAVLGAVFFGGALASQVDWESEGTRQWLQPWIALPLLCLWFALATPTLAGEARQTQAVWQALTGGSPLGPQQVEQLHSATALDPYNPDRQLIVGELLQGGMRSGNSQAVELSNRAQVCYRRVLRVHPFHPSALRHLAELSVGRGERKRALAYLRQLVAVEPWRGNPEELLAELLRRYGQAAFAAKSQFAEHGRAALPDLKLQVEELRAEGKSKQAAQILDELLQAIPDDGDLWRLNARCMKDLGDDPGYLHARRLEQLCYARDSIGLTDWRIARNNVRLARKYVSTTSVWEDLLDAVLEVHDGEPAMAVKILAALDAAEVADHRPPPWIGLTLRALLTVPECQHQLERLQLHDWLLELDDNDHAATSD